jgi:hypothetical protein
MSPLRWDVLLLGFVLALPVLAMGMRGDLTAEEVAMRLPWCLAAAWGAVAVLRFAGTPRTTTDEPAGKKPRQPADLVDAPVPADEHSPAV